MQAAIEYEVRMRAFELERDAAQFHAAAEMGRIRRRGLARAISLPSLRDRAAGRGRVGR